MRKGRICAIRGHRGGGDNCVKVIGDEDEDKKRGWICVRKDGPVRINHGAQRITESRYFEMKMRMRQGWMCVSRGHMIKY